MKSIGSWMIAAGALTAAMPALAAEDQVTAFNPSGLAKVMRDAGYKAELDTDDYGDPFIKTRFGEYNGSVYFYGCNDDTHDRCESVQFRAGLDRKTPMTGDQMNAVVKKYRYAAMWLDDEGDPWINFDVFTGAGIPKTVFLRALEAYSGNLGVVADQVFAEERGE